MVEISDVRFFFLPMVSQIELDGPMDGQTDKASYRVACPQLKRNNMEAKILYLF